MGFSIPEVEKKITQKVVYESLGAGGFHLDANAESAILAAKTTVLTSHTEISDAHISKAKIDNVDCEEVKTQKVHTDVAEISRAFVGQVCAKSISVDQKIELIPNGSKSVIDMGGIVMGSPKEFTFEEKTQISDLFGWEVYTEYEWRTYYGSCR